MRPLKIILLVLVVLFGFVLQAQAQEPPTSPVTLQATAAFAGTVKYGEWLPVQILIENSGPTVSGLVQVRGTSSNSMQRYAQRVELASGARKEVTLYITPTNFSRRLIVEFVPLQGNEALAEGELALRPVPNIRYIIALVGPEDGGLKPLANERFRGEGISAESMIVPLTVESLPDFPEALRSLDLIILSGVDTTAMTAAQRTALEQYVAQGGVLAIGGGALSARVMAGLPESLHPVTLSGEQSLDALPTLAPPGGNEEIRVNGPFVAAKGTPVEGARVDVAHTDGLPLVVERLVGRGAVLWLALDPALSPFDAWAGTGTFWRSIIGTRAIYPPDIPPDVAPRQSLNDQLSYALQNLPSLDLPSLRLLIPLLALYIFAVGPLTYFLLRRKRRLELAWVVIPVLTLLFSLGAYLIGFGLRGNDLIVNQVSVVQVVPGSKSASIQSLIGIFSPSRHTYTMEVSGGNPLLSPANTQSDPFGPSDQSAPSGTQALFLQGEPARVESLAVNQWSMRAVVAEARLSEGFGLDGEATISDNRLVGTVTNSSDTPWDDAVVIMGTRFDRIGAVGPGSSVSFDIALPSNVSNEMIFNDISWEIFSKDQENNGMLPRQAQVRQQILSTIFSSITQSPTGRSVRDPLVVAWNEAAPLTVSVDGTPINDSPATTAIYGYLPTRFGAGEITVPRGLMTATMISNDGGSCYNPGMVSLSPDFREAVIEFGLPSTLRGFEATSGNLFLLADSGAITNAPTVALRDAATEEWVPLDTELRRGRVEIPTMGRFLTPDGTVRVRVTSERSNQNGCLYFDMSLTGTLPTAEGQP